MRFAMPKRYACPEEGREEEKNRFGSSDLRRFGMPRFLSSSRGGIYAAWERSEALAGFSRLSPS